MRPWLRGALTDDWGRSAVSLQHSSTNTQAAAQGRVTEQVFPFVGRLYTVAEGSQSCVRD